MDGRLADQADVNTRALSGGKRVDFLDDLMGAAPPRGPSTVEREDPIDALSAPMMPGEERMRERTAFHSDGLVNGTVTGIEWEALASALTCRALVLSDLYLSIITAWKRAAATAAEASRVGGSAV